MDDLDFPDSVLYSQAVHRGFEVGEWYEIMELLSYRHSLQGEAYPFESSGFE